MTPLLRINVGKGRVGREASGQAEDGKDEDLGDGAISHRGFEGGPVEQVVEGDVNEAEVEVDKFVAQLAVRHEGCWRDERRAVAPGTHEGFVSICQSSSCWGLLNGALEPSSDAKCAARPLAGPVAFLTAVSVAVSQGKGVVGGDWNLGTHRQAIQADRGLIWESGSHRLANVWYGGTTISEPFSLSLNKTVKSYSPRAVRCTSTWPRGLMMV